MSEMPEDYKETGRVNQGKCDHCGLCPTPEDHDGCIGELPTDIVMNACCGHGTDEHAYVQFWNAPRISGKKALAYIDENKFDPSKKINRESALTRVMFKCPECSSCRSAYIENPKDIRLCSCGEVMRIME